MNLNKLGLTIAFSSATLLAGCSFAPSADDAQVKNAVSAALKAEIETGTVKDLAGFPIGKSLATNFSGGEKFVVAKKTADAKSGDCAKFDLTVSNPSTKYLFGLIRLSGDSSYKSDVEICSPRLH